MAQMLRNRRWFHHLSNICCILFAATFVVSGFLKAIDPWGTILAMRNYLVAYNLSMPEWIVRSSSVFLSGVELMIGAMLLLRVRLRLTSVVSVAIMLFFTVLTLLSATIVPVEDCGCFGEAVKLTPWQTFAKNVALLPLILCVWYRYRTDALFAFTKREIISTAVVFILSMSLGIYSYRHLPMIDFLPYKIGVDIAAEREQPNLGHSSEKIILLYRNRITDEVREFSIEDTEWQNEELWEWVDTRTEGATKPLDADYMLLEFHISDSEGDKTDMMLAEPKLFLLFMAETECDETIRERFTAVERYAEQNGGVVAYITPETPISTSYLIYNMDAKTMKSILRADYGLVVLEKGVIVGKYNYRDIPY